MFGRNRRILRKALGKAGLRPERQIFAGRLAAAAAGALFYILFTPPAG